MTKPVSLFEIVDHKYCKICRRSTMGKNIEKRNILFKNRMCSPIIEARSTKRGCESIVKYCFFIVLVLIDTWWNVNLTSTGYVRRDVRFNRYMVECESHFGSCVFVRSRCFNRYMVECEFLSYLCRRTFLIVLIDTWWNVNVRSFKVYGFFRWF